MVRFLHGLVLDARRGQPEIGREGTEGEEKGGDERAYTTGVGIVAESKRRKQGKARGWLCAQGAWADFCGAGRSDERNHLARASALLL